MALHETYDPSSLVEPNRVRAAAYVDTDIFDLEMQRIHEQVWIYCGHESQIPAAGDYYTVQVGRQPMIMVRAKDKQINVLYNRCPHRGAMICGDLHGNTGKFFRCSYHSWTFHHDGKLKQIPMMKSSYEGTGWGRDNADCQMHSARVDSYRGFVFANLGQGDETLLEFLAGSKMAIDDMCDRSPEGEVEIVPNCNRVIQQANWKIFIENQIDALHPSVTHQSTGAAARAIELAIEKQTGEAPLSYHMLSAFATLKVEDWDAFETRSYPNGHTSIAGYMGLRREDPDTLEYERRMEAAYGKKRMEEILAVNVHHMMFYPGLGIQPPLQQLRVVRPLSVDRTLTEIWHFRLKGAPEAIYRRSLDYYNLVNSPATLINADDMENFWKCQQGLRSKANDWISFHRHAGRDVEMPDYVASPPGGGTSEAPMRNQMRAWAHYMSN